MSTDDPYSRDALFYAAGDDDIRTVRARLGAGIPVNVRERRAALTPLFFAVEGGALRTLDLLIAWGADLEARSEPRRMTPLLYAVLCWRAAPDGRVVRRLLEHGADRSAGDNHGRTAHHVALGMPDLPVHIATALDPAPGLG